MHQLLIKINTRVSAFPIVLYEPTKFKNPMNAITEKQNAARSARPVAQRPPQFALLLASRSKLISNG